MNRSLPLALVLGSLFLIHCGSTATNAEGAHAEDAGEDAAKSDTGTSTDTASGTEVIADAAPLPPPCTLPSASLAPGLDPKFTVGTKPRDSGEVGIASAFPLVDPKGRPVVFGHAAIKRGPAWTWGLMVHRYSSTGEPDASYSSGARDLLKDTELEPRAFSGAFDAKGRLVLVGQVRVGPAPTHGEVFVMRLLEDGAIDTSFASASEHPGVHVHLPTGCADSSGMQVTTIGTRSYVLANCLLAGTRLLRYDANGVLDSSFSPKLATMVRPIAAGDNLYVQTYPGSIVKLRADGSSDTAFASGGTWTPGNAHEIRHVAAAFDAGLLVAHAEPGKHLVELSRLDAKGVPVAGFGGSYDDTELPVDAIAQRCDRAWASTASWAYGNERASLHFTAKGARDGAWGPAGVSSKISLIPSGTTVVHSAPTIDPKGGVLVAGLLDNQVWLARYY